METIRFERLRPHEGAIILDVGCGGGRHAYGALRRGASVVACDTDRSSLSAVKSLMTAMAEGGEAPPDALATVVCCDVRRLPFADSSYQAVVASEVLEHIPDEGDAVAEFARVLADGGTLAVSVPSWLPEKLCWLLSNDYHAPAQPGGHLRIYTRSSLRELLASSGLKPSKQHRAHALHSPYWWLRCAVGPNNDRNPLVKAYHRLLCWEITRKPSSLRLLERILSPMIGKSLVLYADLEEGGGTTSGDAGGFAQR